MTLEMKIAILLIAMVSTYTLTEGKLRRYRRRTNELKQSYLVHYNNKGEPLSVAGFEDFVRVLNGQQPSFGLRASSFAEIPEFPPLQATPTTFPELMTTTEPTTPHQPRPLATGTSRTPESIVAGVASPGLAYVTVGTTAAPLKLPHEMSGTSPMAEASVSTDKPTLTLALGHDAASTSGRPERPNSLSEVSNLVTPGENPPSKMTVSSLRFPYGSELTSKVISLQPEIQTILNYAQSSIANHGYNIPASQMSYVHTLPTATLQSNYAAASIRPETFNYAPYSRQNIAIDGVVPLQIVRHQEPSLIDIGQGLGQGYQRSTSQGLPLNLGGWGGVDYRDQRSIPLIKPVLSITKLGYTLPVSSHVLPKIGFGLGSW